MAVTSISGAVNFVLLAVNIKYITNTTKGNTQKRWILMIKMLMIYLSKAIGFTPGGSNTVHIYTQTIHRTTQITTEQHK